MSYRNLLRMVALGCMALTLVATSPAQTVFTLTGEATSTAGGYTTGQAVTFSLTLIPGFPNTPTSTFSSSGDTWDKSVLDDSTPFLFASFTGTGIASIGGALGNNSASVQMGANSLAFAFVVTGDAWNTPNGDRIEAISFTLNPASPVFSFTPSETYVNPADYFAAYVGEYGLGGASIGVGEILGRNEEDNTERIDLNFSKIGVNTVPEPSIWALAGLGAAVIGGLTLQRRRAQRSGSKA